MKTRKNRTIMLIAACVCIAIVVACVIYIAYIFSGNYITYEFEDDLANTVETSLAKNASPIIVNGLVLGGSKDGKWVSASALYNANNYEKGIKVDLYSENKMYGTFDTAKFMRYDKSVIYTTIARTNLPDKYIAVVTGTLKGPLSGMTKVQPTALDEKYVKEALGSYNMINGSIRITEVYSTAINQANDKIICAVSSKSNWLGVYSVVVYVTGNKASIVKYSHVRDTKSADRFPIYSLQFVMDLNEDNKPEIVLSEITGNTLTYSVLEKRESNRFYTVLKTTVEIK